MKAGLRALGTSVAIVLSSSLARAVEGVAGLEGIELPAEPVELASVPESSTYLLLLMVAAGWMLWLRHKRRRSW
jgi:hypothetical protein